MMDVWYHIDGGDGMQEAQQRDREKQDLKVGDLVVYDPVVYYLLNNDEILGVTGVVLDMNPSGLDIQVLVGSRRFWCHLTDLKLVVSNT
jgi:hypothetical protein